MRELVWVVLQKLGISLNNGTSLKELREEVKALTDVSNRVRDAFSEEIALRQGRIAQLEAEARQEKRARTLVPAEAK